MKMIFLKIPRLRIWGVRYVEYIYIMIHIYVRIMNIRYQIFENGLVTGVREGCVTFHKKVYLEMCLVTLKEEST